MSRFSSSAAVEVLRGALLAPRADAVDLVADGEILMDRHGLIAYAGPATSGLAPTIEFDGPVVLQPGFVDAHVHLPQLSVRGREAGPLLEWLETLVFPAERAFADRHAAERGTADFERALLRCGTTTAGVYVTVHTEATRIALARSKVRGPVGKVLMDRGAPPELCEAPGPALDALTHLIAEFGERAAVVPRFAVGCTPELLAGAAELARSTGAIVMTHLAETGAEVELVRELFPGARSYTAVYDDAGLLGARTLLAHCIHLDDEEIERIARRGATVVHCPTANRALGSGRMPLERLRERGVGLALGTDVGAGPSLSMWHVIAAYLEVHRAHARTTPEEGFSLATLGGARALGMERSVGSLDAGKAADVAAFPYPRGASTAAEVIAALAAGTTTAPEPQSLATWIGGQRVPTTNEPGA